MLLVATEDFANGHQNLVIVKFIEQLGSSRCWVLVAWWSMRGCYMHSSCSSSHLQCGRWSCEVLRCSLFIVHCSFCAVRWSCPLCDIHCSLKLCFVRCSLKLCFLRCSLKLCVIRWSCALCYEVVRCVLFIVRWSCALCSQRHFPLSFLRRQWEGCRYLVTEPEISNLLGRIPKHTVGKRQTHSEEKANTQWGKDKPSEISNTQWEKSQTHSGKNPKHTVEKRQTQWGKGKHTMGKGKP